MCFFLAITLPVSVLVQAQTIADAARQERERRKAVENQASEIPAVNSTTPAPSAVSTARPQGKTVQANEQLKYAGQTDLQGHGENYWRPKFDQARQAVQRAEENLKIADQKVANSSSMWTTYGPIVGRNTMALQQATREQQVARKALADAQQKLSDLEDQLRRAGGLPGWSRPR
jgi:hypothetical protein